MNQATLDLKSLKDTYERRLYLFAFKLLKDKDQAMIAVADVFIRLWKNHHLLDEVINIEQYLYTAVRNACYDLVKKKPSVFLVDPVRLEMLALEWEENEAHLIIRTELMADLLDEWVRNLPDPHRTIIQRLYYDNEKIMDLCASMDLSRYQVNNYKIEAFDLMKTQAKKAGRLKALLVLAILQLLYP